MFRADLGSLQADMVHSVAELYMLIEVVVFTVILKILHGLVLRGECRGIWRKGEITIGHQLMWKVGSTYIIND